MLVYRRVCHPNEKHPPLLVLLLPQQLSNSISLTSWKLEEPLSHWISWIRCKEVNLNPMGWGFRIWIYNHIIFSTRSLESSHQRQNVPQKIEGMAFSSGTGFPDLSFLGEPDPGRFETTTKFYLKSLLLSASKSFTTQQIQPNSPNENPNPQRQIPTTNPQGS